MRSVHVSVKEGETAVQDAYVGDIGDYGKYGLLRVLAGHGLRLGVNWYAVASQKTGKQDDGKFIQYLLSPGEYRRYDPELFDALDNIVNHEKNRTLVRIEALKLFPAQFYSVPLTGKREVWHHQALETLAGAELVFLDPDNGLETERMYQTGKSTEKHVRTEELADYYRRGQSVVLYQHRPQMTPKDRCIQAVLDMQDRYLCADQVRILEFPRYTNRFYFFFLHRAHVSPVERTCEYMKKHWTGLCRDIQA